MDRASGARPVSRPSSRVRRSSAPTATCSAAADPDLRVVYLKGEREQLETRLAQRRDHFFPAALLDAQLADLEEPTPDEDPRVVHIGGRSPTRSTPSSERWPGKLKAWPTAAITFTNVFNFRDLGGYRSADGRTVRWRRLFRSDDLSRLRADEADRFLELGIRTVVDLRRPNEIAADGRILPLDGCAYHHVHLTHPAWPARHFADTAARAEFVLERYLEMSDEAADGVGRGPAAHRRPATRRRWWSTASPARTAPGSCRRSTLALLGVPDEDIADDYTMSELVEPQSWAYIMRDRPGSGGRAVDPHHGVAARGHAAVPGRTARARHGSIEAYAASSA